MLFSLLKELGSLLGGHRGGCDPEFEVALAEDVKVGEMHAAGKCFRYFGSEGFPDDFRVDLGPHVDAEVTAAGSEGKAEEKEEGNS